MKRKILVVLCAVWIGVVGQAAVEKMQVAGEQEDGDQVSTETESIADTKKSTHHQEDGDKASSVAQGSMEDKTAWQAEFSAPADPLRRNNMKRGAMNPKTSSILNILFILSKIPAFSDSRRAFSLTCHSTENSEEPCL